MTECFEFPDRGTIEKGAVDYATDNLQDMLTHYEDTLLSWSWMMKKRQYETIGSTDDRTEIIVRLLDWVKYDEYYKMPQSIELHIKSNDHKWAFSVSFDFSNVLDPDFIEAFYPPFDLAHRRLLWVLGDTAEFKKWILIWKLSLNQDGEV